MNWASARRAPVHAPLDVDDGVGANEAENDETQLQRDCERA